jgi:cell division protein FtsL
VKFSALAAPERIAKVATEKLGLVPPQQGQVLMVHLPGEAPSLTLPSVELIRVAKHDSIRRENE